MEKKNNENDTLKKGKRVRTLAGITIASMLTGFVVGGTILLNEGSAENTVNSKKLEDTEIVAEEFKYKGEDEGSILNIQEELTKIDREETKKRQEESKKQLPEQTQEEQLAEEARVKAEEEAQIVAEQQEEPQQVTQAPKQKTQAPKQNTQAPKQNTNINNDENVDPKDVYGHLYEEEHAIPYETEYIENPLLEEGQENVILEGVNGIEVHIYDVTILGGGDYKRTLDYKFMRQNPINRIVEVKQKP